MKVPSIFSLCVASTKITLKNLHSQIRASGGHNQHPDVVAYMNALRGLACMFLTSELIQTAHCSGANCENSSWEVEGAGSDENASPNAIMEEDETADEEEEVDEEEEEEVDEVEEDDPEELQEPPARDSHVRALSDIEEEVATYIAGAAVHSLKNNKGRCNECMSLLISSDAPHAVFTSFKEYKEGALVNTSLALRQLASSFEVHFKLNVEQAFLSEQPCHFITSSFSDTNPNLSNFQCSRHGNSIAFEFIKMLCITRIFHTVNLINENLHSKVKGSELTKSRRLNF